MHWVLKRKYVLIKRIVKNNWLNVWKKTYCNEVMDNFSVIAYSLVACMVLSKWRMKNWLDKIINFGARYGIPVWQHIGQSTTATSTVLAGTVAIWPQMLKSDVKPKQTNIWATYIFIVLVVLHWSMPLTHNMTCLVAGVKWLHLTYCCDCFSLFLIL